MDFWLFLIILGVFLILIFKYIFYVFWGILYMYTMYFNHIHLLFHFNLCAVYVCIRVCVHMCMCMHMCILWCVHVHTHAWCMHRRVQRLTLNVFLDHPPLYFLRQDLSLHLELAISARLVG